jgi:hypothetical protein
MENKYCRNCGCLIEEGMQLCPNCHAYVGNNPPVQYIQYVESAPVKKRSTASIVRIVALITLSVLFVVAICVGGVILKNKLDDDSDSKSSKKKTEKTTAENTEDIASILAENLDNQQSKNDPVPTEKVTIPKETKLAKAPKDAYFRSNGDYSGNAVNGSKDADGLEIPAVGAGETLYIGYGEVDGVGMLKYAAVLSADKTKITTMNTFEGDFANPLKGTTINFSSINRTRKEALVIPSTSDQAFWESTVKETVLYDDVIYIKLHYVVKLMLVDKYIDVGDVEIWMKKAGT